ncbi:MAG TPA: FAD-dependent oxidoreductase, partial [Polymorphobacter sp.]|nr:FAD-dependent oxidoreductase [Polymorphobacter sp.]
MHYRSLLALALVAPLLPATAAEQVVVPPKARYWMSATTANGMSMGGGMSQADMMKMALGQSGGGGGAQKLLDLDLGSTLAPTGGGPKADALIPPGMNMGASLPLTTPVAKPAQRAPEREDDDFERPKGKLLLFWGCSEKARPGQPLVIDFATMAAGQMPANLFGGERVRIQPGVTVKQANARLAAYGRKLGPDPASEAACTIGGVVANNSSGMACGTVENSYRTLESLVVVLPSGTV